MTAQLTAPVLPPLDLSAPFPSERSTAEARFWFNLGKGNGYRAGWLDGRDAEREAWNQIVAGWAAAAKQPTTEERDRALADAPDRPCTAKCQKCSRCTRYIAAWHNQRRTGSFDYLGGPVAAW